MHGIEIQTAARFGVKAIFLDANNGEKIRTRRPILADRVYRRTLKAAQLVLQGMWSARPCPRCRR